MVDGATGLVFSRDTEFIGDEEPVVSDGPWLMSISHVGERRVHSGALPYGQRLY